MLKRESSPTMKGTVLQEFYRGTTIFVTGGSGTMGKVLVEKLLRSCPNITRIYLLIRAKKGRSAQERMDDLISSLCFSELLRHQPEVRSKLSAVAGDASQDALGLSAADRRLLSEQVSVVFHLAATVRFDEPLKIAVAQNTRGTREMMVLCKTFTKLKSVVYVSTAFSNCTSTTSRTEERLYAPPLPCQKAIELAERLDNEVLSAMTTGLLGSWPNSYTWSKALAEDAVKCYGQGLPVGVFRPSIVVNSIDEPVRGWVDSVFGPMGVTLGIATGVVRAVEVNAYAVCHIVPCDMSINCLIASAWDVAKNKTASTEIPVYNCVVPKANSITWRQGLSYLDKYIPQFPMVGARWYMGAFFTHNKLLLNILYALLHMLPAMLVDLFLVLTSKPTQMVKIMKKIQRVQSTYCFFTVRHWEFEGGNVQHMWDQLDAADQKIFNFDFITLDWDRFYKNGWLGVRKYLAKEEPDTMHAARVKMQRLYYLHRATQCVLTCLFAYLSWTTLSSLWLVGVTQA